LGDIAGDLGDYDELGADETLGEPEEGQVVDPYYYSDYDYTTLNIHIDKDHVQAFDKTDEHREDGASQVGQSESGGISDQNEESEKTSGNERDEL
jgi:hypothetical protein